MINEAYQKKDHLLAVFFDISKAFDIIWRSKILSTLLSWNICGNLQFFVYNFLLRREFLVRISNSTSNTYPLLNGVPQDTVLSPTLFIIGINDLANSISPLISKPLFADDFSTFIRCKDPKIGESLLQIATNQIHNWTQKNGLSISYAKSTAIHFCKHYKCSKTLNVHLNHTSIPVSDRVKYLGVIFDNTSSWTPQIQNLKSKCFKKLNLLKKLAHTSYGSDRLMLIKLYHTLIRPIIDYGAPLYCFAPKSRLDSLNVIHNTCLRLITGAFRTTPIDSLLCEAAEPPLSIRRLYTSVNTSLNILANPNFNISLQFLVPQNTISYSKDLLHKIHSKNSVISFLPTNINPPWLTYSPKIDFSLTELPKSQTNPQIYVQNFNELLSKYPNFVQIFTDGSKTPNQSGCSIVLDNCAIPYPLPPYFTILSAELYAIKLAIYHCLENTSNNFLILSDSLSALLSIQNYHKKKHHPISQQIIQTLSSTGKTIILCWIPSHSNIHKNILADEAARISLTTSPIPNIPIPLSDLKTYNKTLLLESFQHHWNLVPSTNKLKLIKNTTIPWKTSSQTIRRNEIILCRLRTGHSSLTHGYILNKQLPPLCDSCNTPVSIKHILIDCPKFQAQRNIYFPNETIETILSDNQNCVRNILSFLKTTKLYSLM